MRITYAQLIRHSDIDAYVNVADLTDKIKTSEYIVMPRLSLYADTDQGWKLVFNTKEMGYAGTRILTDELIYGHLSAEFTARVKYFNAMLSPIANSSDLIHRHLYRLYEALDNNETLLINNLGGYCRLEDTTVLGYQYFKTFPREYNLGINGIILDDGTLITCGHNKHNEIIQEHKLENKTQFIHLSSNYQTYHFAHIHGNVTPAQQQTLSKICNNLSKEQRQQLNINDILKRKRTHY